MNFYMAILPAMLKGAFLTAQISVLSILMGLILGGFLGVLTSDLVRYPIVTPLIKTYVYIIRGTPLFVQLLMVYYALPEVLGFDIPAFWAGVFTLSLNSCAYLSETIRGGINGVALGQWESARVLGYSTSKALRFIILPQALRNVLPAITNELAVLVKESSILMVIGISELIKVSKDTVARELKPMEVYMMTALLYLLMTSFITLCADKLEAKIK